MSFLIFWYTEMRVCLVSLSLDLLGMGESASASKLDSSPPKEKGFWRKLIDRLFSTLSEGSGLNLPRLLPSFSMRREDKNLI